MSLKGIGGLGLEIRVFSVEECGAGGVVVEAEIEEILLLFGFSLSSSLRKVW